MSDIDLNQHIFDGEYANSQCESFNGDRYSHQFANVLDINPDELQSKEFSFVRTNAVQRRSQTTTSQKSSPLKLNAALLRSQENPTTNGRESIRQDKNPKSSMLSTIASTDRFECQHKLFTIDQCEICHGKGFVQGSNNYVKFFEYVIAFKFGVCESYREKKLLKRKKTEVNSFCNDYYNQEASTNSVRNSQAGGGVFKIVSKNSIKAKSSMSASVNLEAKRQRESSFVNMDRNSKERQSMVSGFERFSIGSAIGRTSMGSNMGRMSYKSSKRCCKNEIIEQINNMNTIHQDYVCDICQSQPIVGPRFHCSQCQDYDICEHCFNRCQAPHEHQLEKVDKNAKTKQLENIMNMFQPIFGSGRLNLRPPPAIDTLSERPITPRSTIR